MSEPSIDKGASPKKSPFRRFCLDVWYIHLIILVVVVLAVALPLVYVGYPNIAQDNVNGSNLNLTELSLTRPEPNSFQLSLAAELTVHSAFKPTLYPWNASVYVDGTDQPFMTLPVQRLAGKTGSVASYNGRMNLTEAQINPFANYMAVTAASGTVTNRLIGKGPLKLGGLPKININYNKTLEQGGLQGLRGVKISNARLLTGPQPDNATLAGTVNIPNPSLATVELGNLTMGISLPASVLGTDLPTTLGTATVNNTFLKPNSDNFFDLRSVANQAIVLQAVSKNATILKTGLPMTVTVSKVEYNGQEIPYLTQALSAAPIAQVLNISEILANSGGALTGLSGKKRAVETLAELWKYDGGELDTQKS